MSREVVLYLLAGIPLALAYPPFHYGFLAYWAFIPFLLLVENKTFGAAFRWGYGVGLTVSAAAVFSNLWLNFPAAIAFVIFQPLYFALFAVLVQPLRKLWPASYLALVPFLWAFLEYARSFSEPAAPSLKLCYTQEYFLQLVQYGPSISLFLVSFWVVALNVLLLAMWRLRENLSACLGVAAVLLFFFVMPYLYGKFVQSRPNGWQEKAIEVRRTILRGTLPEDRNYNYGRFQSAKAFM